MIYPTGTRIHWRASIPPRTGQQSGVLSRPWHRFAAFPWIVWDGEEAERQELPECVSLTQQASAVVSVRDAWTAGKQVAR